MNIFLYDAYYSGGGVAVGDVNADGLPDLYFSANLLPNRLYLNEGGLRFRDVTSQAGVAGSPGWSTGVCMVDINADGLLDIYVCKSGKLPPEQRRNELFINNGDGTFSERAAEFGLDDAGNSMHAVFFDADGDGDLDAYLMNYPTESFKNIYIEQVRQERHPDFGDRFYRNEGGRFRDVSEQAGISGSPIGFAQSAAVADFNQDGWPDLYIGNDFTEHDFYYLNNGDGTFRESLKSAFGHCSHFSMGSDAQDIDRDGWPDLVVLDMLPADNYRQKTLLGPNGYDKYQLQIQRGFHRQQMRNTLQLNDGDGRFREVGQWSGISNTDWSWAPLLADYDNDGWMDLYITNGFRRDYTNLDFLKYDAPAMRKEATARGQEPDLAAMVRSLPSVRLPNYAFRQTGEGRFEDATRAWGMSQPSFSNGAAWADLDADGDLDLVVNNIDDTPFLYENRAAPGAAADQAVEDPAPGAWVQFVLRGQPNNPFGLGASVRVECTDGQRWEQMLVPNRGFLSSTEPLLHFGLGRAEAIARVSVRWSDGRVQVLAPVEMRQRHTLQYEQAAPGTWVFASRPEPLFAEERMPELPSYENDAVDFRTEPLLPHFCSTQGPFLAAWPPDAEQPELLYLSGARGVPGQIFRVQPGGALSPLPQEALKRDLGCEDGGAVWLDANRDGHPDLYVASGGYEVAAADPALRDRLYLGDGRGNWRASDQELAFTGVCAGSAPAAADFDRDGWTDLFVGGRVVPGQYGQAPTSHLLRNVQGVFQPVALPAQPGGLVTAAQWADLDGDGWPELLVAGEWMPVIYYPNRAGELQAPVALPAGSGWWYSLLVRDLDGDGSPEICAGNRGWNGQMQASTAQPVRMFVKDYDGNGQTEPIITYSIGDRAWPLATRDELLDQLPMLKKRFTRYAPYGEADYEGLFTQQEREGALAYQAETFASGLFRRHPDGTYRWEPFPASAQQAPVWGISAVPAAGSGPQGLLLTGNFFDNRAQDGAMNAGRGLVLRPDAAGNWQVLSPAASGLLTRGDARAVVWVAPGVFLLGNNSGLLQRFRYLPGQAAGGPSGAVSFVP